MTLLDAGRTGPDLSTSTAVGWLFTADHPRAIDRYIDYFGGRLGTDASHESNPSVKASLTPLAEQNGPTT